MVPLYQFRKLFDTQSRPFPSGDFDNFVIRVVFANKKIQSYFNFYKTSKKYSLLKTWSYENVERGWHKR